MANNLANEIELGDNIKQNDIEEEETKEPHIPSNRGSGSGSHSHSHSVNAALNTNGEQWTKWKLMTWNLWCIPVSSPRCLSNPDRCSQYLYNLAQKQQWQNYDGLIVVALQELWCWKTGIFPPVLLRLVSYLEYIPYIGRLFAAVFTILSLLFGSLPILKCLPIQYDPKSRFIHKMRHHLPFATRNNDIPIYKFMDNGLAILSNKNPSNWGFQPYQHEACDDSCVNKGWLWCYYAEQRFMLINTHMQAAGAGYERLLQIKELKLWLYDNWESKGMIDKCVILGDFNVDMESHPQRVQLYNDALKNGRKSELIDISYENEQKRDINDVVLSVSSSAGKRHKNHEHKSGIIEIETKIKQDIYDELGDDSLTCLHCVEKESLADNLMKLKMARQDGKKRKFTKKAYINIPYHLGEKYHKLNRFEPTFKRAEYNIDHIFANFECHKVKNSLLALGRYKLSDHRLVVSEFTTD